MIFLVFVLGIIVGILLTLVIVANRQIIVRAVDWTDDKLSLTGIKEGGAVFIPPTEMQEAQAAVIETNNKEGKPTPVEDLV